MRPHYLFCRSCAFLVQTIVEQPTDLDLLSDKYAKAAKEFVADAAAAGSPFFLYYAASHVHVPQNHHPRWDNFSKQAAERGAFGASLLEMDYEFGTIMDALREAGVYEDTLVLVTGDNGPWECKCELTGVAGPYRGEWQRANGGGSASKTTLWEGGHRVVGLASWPSVIAPGVSAALTSSLDFMPTLAALAGAPLPLESPSGEVLHFDGIDLTALFLSKSEAGSDANSGNITQHETLFHPLSGACGSGPIGAARWGRYKAVLHSGGTPACGGSKAPCKLHDPPLLFDVQNDPAEAEPLDTTDPSSAAGQAIAKLVAAIAEVNADIGSTARTVADYGRDDAGYAATCCNSTNTACACHANWPSLPAWLS